MNLSHFISLWLGNAVIVLAVIGIAWRWLVRPHLTRWITENLIHPMTANGGKNDPPTLPDRLHDQNVVMERIEDKIDAQGEAMIRHAAWSAEETSRLWTAIHKKVDKR